MIFKDFKWFFTWILFENVVAMAIKNDLYLPLWSQNLSFTYWNWSPKVSGGNLQLLQNYLSKTTKEGKKHNQVLND